MVSNSVMLPAEEHLAFHHALGVAIVQWAHVENSMFHVALACFEPCKPQQIASGFYAIENYRSKLNFVHRVFQTSKHVDSHWHEWSTLSQHLEGLSKKRNAVAHGKLIVYPHAPEGRRYALAPMVYDEPKKKSAQGHPPPGSLCVRDIDLYGKQFSKASVRLHSLYDRISGNEDLLGEFAQQEPQALTLAQLRRQIYAMSPRRTKS